MIKITKIRKKATTCILSITLVLAMVFGFATPVVAAANDPVEAFVARLYTLVLNRPADPQGLHDWTNILKSGQGGGANVAYGFFFSLEMKNRDLGNAEYVEILYNTLLGRPSDTEGKAAWTNSLYMGHSREAVFAGFVNSVEFGDICNSYGIVRGSYTVPVNNNVVADASVDVDMVRAFIMRLYTNVLGRGADATGLRAWTTILASRQGDGATVAYGFFFSQEMRIRNLTHGQYVDVLYQTLMNRPADASGRAAWISLLVQGYPREQIFHGLVMSVEFEILCNAYGINRGTYTPPILLNTPSFETSPTSVSLRNQNITSQRLAEMVRTGEIPANVERLDLAINSITDISPLSSLTNLVMLDLWGNDVADVSPLRNLTELIELNLWGNNFRDISSLSNLTNLADLALGGSNLNFNGDLSVLRNFTNLTTLGLGSTWRNPMDFSPLNVLVNLERLQLWGASQLSDLSVIGTLTNLTHLTIHAANIKDFTPLGNLTKLTRLDLQSSEIGDISKLNLHRFPNLTDLGLFNNNITDVSQLSRLTNLTHLSLGYNQITDISPLMNLTKLTYLHLEANPIAQRDIDALAAALPTTQISLHSIHLPADGGEVTIPLYG